MDSKVDTLFPDRVFPSLTFVDSVTGKGLTIQPVHNNRNAFLIEVRDSSVKFHEIFVYKGGKMVTLMTLNDYSTNKLIEDSTVIIFKGMLNKRLLFEYAKRPSEFYALWQNVVLPSSFITFGKKNVSIQIPKETKQVKESCIRIFGINGNKMVLDRRVSLIYGMPLLDED